MNLSEEIQIVEALFLLHRNHSPKPLLTLYLKLTHQNWMRPLKELNRHYEKPIDPSKFKGLRWFPLTTLPNLNMDKKYA
ncbi:MAG: hypothetical protein CM1200mP10_31060 [Candidatus Neomarinimicrobiota bacterium]|nr:MAG: hypothetical protein CM1200mP10_31060 [Candidatus Neomarinimicrobiota bacterium]